MIHFGLHLSHLILSGLDLAEILSYSLFNKSEFSIFRKLLEIFELFF